MLRMEVRYADEEDLSWLVEKDHHVRDHWVSRCIALKEYLICERETVRIGFLRYSLFWGAIPYMDMIFVLDRHRRSGAGTALFESWETKMAAGGATILMTSSETNEKEPREWHRRNGFEECGRLAFGHLGMPSETFLVKNL